MSVASDFAQSLRIALDELEHDEWAVVRARERATQGLSSADAFSSIVEVLGLAATQSDPYGFSSCCQVALSLAYIADTTERPAGLEAALAQLESHAQTLGCIRDLAEVRTWYRIAA
jgi:hypothetical protein